MVIRTSFCVMIIPRVAYKLHESHCGLSQYKHHTVISQSYWINITTTNVQVGKLWPPQILMNAYF